MAENEVQEPSPLAPISYIPTDKKGEAPRVGIALCLSGGGYRAMLFHVGTLWRLNEAGLLPKLIRVSSVSGGSIASGFLGLRWARLDFHPTTGISNRFEEFVVRPLRALSNNTLDVRNIVLGALLPGTISDWVTKSLQKYLYGDSTLQELPDTPRFVINATNVQSMALWRFSKPYMADYRVGVVPNPKLLLAKAVTASAAFPPLLSPVNLPLTPSDFTSGSGLDLQREPYTTNIKLTDGGVYDNLGLETAWKLYRTILVSDGGAKAAAEPEPKNDWVRHGLRIVEVIDNQVRSLRYRQIMQAFKDKDDLHDGAYWGIRTPIDEYRLSDALPCPEQRTTELAQIPTRLKSLSSDIQERLINWGYAACDASLRTFFKPTPSSPLGFPYPAQGV